MRQGNVLGATRATEDISTVPAVVFAIRERELLATSHADVGIGPLWRRRAVEHAAGDLMPRWKVKAFVLQRPVALRQVVEAVLS